MSPPPSPLVLLRATVREWSLLPPFARQPPPSGTRDLLHVEVNHMDWSQSGERLWCAVRLACGVDESSPVQPEALQMTGDGASANHAAFDEFEGDSHRPPFPSSAE